MYYDQWPPKCLKALLIFSRNKQTTGWKESMLATVKQDMELDIWMIRKTWRALKNILKRIDS